MPELTLPSTMDRRSASDLSAILLTHRGEALDINAGEVRVLSTVGVEMLVAASRQWQADGAEFRLHSWSSNGLQTLANIGATPELFQPGDEI